MPIALHKLGPELREQVRRNLEVHERSAVTDVSGLRPSAVAITLTDDHLGQPCFLLTLRQASLRRHAGQFALPGGRLDPGETPEDAARRELEEELGVVLDASSVLGCLDDFASRSGHLITPVVVWAGPGVELTPGADEVAEAYRVPLEQLFWPGNPHTQASGHAERPLISLSLMETMVYAPTAAILYQFREVALWGRSVRVAHFEQPGWAWR